MLEILVSVDGNNTNVKMSMMQNLQVNNISSCAKSKKTTHANMQA